MHEIGHLNQDTKKLQEVIDGCIDEKHKNMIYQIKEMDADLFAVNGFLRHIYNTFNDKTSTYNKAYSFFYQNDFNLIRYSLIIILTTFYFLSNKTNKKINLLNSTYPRNSIRINYIVRQTLNNSVFNELLNINNWQVCQNKSLADFNYIIAKIFPNNNFKDFYESNQKEELLAHYKFLRKEARNYNGLLNGTYE